MTSLLAIIGLVAWAHVLDTFVHRRLTCPHPLPGPSFPWHRCLPGCSWCDYIADWDQEEPQRGHGPYR